MHHNGAEQATGEMPEIACPDPLDGTAVDELPEDRVDAVAHPAEASTPAWVGITFSVAVGHQHLDRVLPSLGSPQG